MKTVLLLVASNIFMTFAWYGQLKMKIFEYCLMVPANRMGYASGLNGYQLKVMQEVVTLVVFVGFAWLVLGERFTWNYAVSFTLILLAVYFAVAVKPGNPST